jgi:hypothetical protein
VGHVGTIADVAGDDGFSWEGWVDLSFSGFAVGSVL